MLSMKQVDVSNLPRAGRDDDWAFGGKKVFRK
jgi:hypothetical protein